MVDARALERDLLASRERCTRVTADLDGERLLGPQLAIVNPPLWEIGHVGWFQERWCLRLQPSGALAGSILPGADALYDSSAVAHDTRWSLPLPDLAATRAYLANILERVRERLAREPENESLAYFVRLATFHEDMHAEAFHYTRQTLAYPDPFRGAPAAAAPAPRGDAAYPGGRFRLGAEPGDGFVFDNEKWAHEIEVAPFRMARAPVTNAEFLDYVEAGGPAPRYWRKTDGAWMQRRFDRWSPLVADEPVLHVGWNEAQAYCRWARRRLPSEAEWEFAAATAAKQRYPWGDEEPGLARANLGGAGLAPVGGCAAGDNAAGARQLIGNVWEWTASTFAPYPGFVVDPYQEYSAPWFGTHKVLRGGSFATPARLIRNTWRNFYTADRGDVFAGFRTCAID
jgi:iron(II)-dependent oxidoreductase